MRELMKEQNDQNNFGWWLTLFSVTTGILLFQICEAAMTSVFDEDE
jgi:hypothetical protein